MKNPKSWALKSGIQLEESGIPQTIKFEIQVQLTRNTEYRRTWSLEFTAWNPESKNDLFIHVAMLHETIHYFMVLLIIAYVCCMFYSRKVVGKNEHATIPKGNMGYAQYTVPDTVAVEPTFVAFL